MITNTISYDTPEGIRLTLTPANFMLRGVAFLIDAIIRAVLMWGIVLVFATLGEFGFGLALVGLFVVFWLYPVFFEVFWGGQTLGKKMVKIRVCMDNGLPIGWQASMIRNLLILADFLPVVFFAGTASMLFSKQSKRLGDIVAGTVVVYAGESVEHFDIMPAAPILPPMRLTLAEQQAILHFVERQETFSSDRADELANLLSPLTQDSKLPIKQTLLGYANAIVGQNNATNNATINATTNATTKNKAKQGGKA